MYYVKKDLFGYFKIREEQNNDNETGLNRYQHLHPFVCSHSNFEFLYLTTYCVLAFSFLIFYFFLDLFYIFFFPNAWHCVRQRLASWRTSPPHCSHVDRLPTASVPNCNSPQHLQQTKPLLRYEGS